MSLPHVIMFAEAASRKARRELVNIMDVSRVAYHAQEKDYTEVRKDILG